MKPWKIEIYSNEVEPSVAVCTVMLRGKSEEEALRIAQDYYLAMHSTIAKDITVKLCDPQHISDIDMIMLDELKEGELAAIVKYKYRL